MLPLKICLPTALALWVLNSPALGELRIVSPRDGARVSHDGPINIMARNDGLTADSIIITRDGIPLGICRGTSSCWLSWPGIAIDPGAHTIGATAEMSGQQTDAPPIHIIVSKPKQLQVSRVLSPPNVIYGIINPNPDKIIPGVRFTDLLPTGLTVASPSGLKGWCSSRSSTICACKGGTVSATPGSNRIDLSGLSLPPLGKCSFSVDLRGTPGTGGSFSGAPNMVYLLAPPLGDH